MTDTTRHDAWQAGDSYDQYMGRWSRQIAPAFLAWLDAPRGKDWLDVGCGTGALTAAIITLLGSARDPESRRVVGLRVIGVFLVLVVVLSAFFLPIWTGMEIPRWYLNLHFWFRSWI